jgi:chemotaxis protein MotB
MNKARETIIIVRKKRGHGSKHHGGAWKVAFADFMTSMMALFLVLWIVTQSSDVRAAIAGYFQDPLGREHEFGATIIKGEATEHLDPRPVNQQDVTRIQQQLMAKLGAHIRATLGEKAQFRGLADHVEIQVTGEGLKIQLLEDSSGVFFETGSPKPRAQVDSLFEMLGQELGSLSHRVSVEGYTDAIPYRADAPYTNWELSADRANAARRLLVKGGLSPSQIWEVRGHADRELRVPGQPTSPTNRRVTITMLFDSSATAASAAAATPSLDLSDSAAPSSPATTIDSGSPTASITEKRGAQNAKPVAATP